MINNNPLKTANLYIPGGSLCVLSFINLVLDFFSNLNPYVAQQREMSAKYCLYVSELKRFLLLYYY